MVKLTKTSPLRLVMFSVRLLYTTRFTNLKTQTQTHTDIDTVTHRDKQTDRHTRCN